MRILSLLRAASVRLRHAFRADADSLHADADFQAELESHLAMHIDENIRRGMSPEDARRDALLAAGGLTVAAETARDRRGLPWLEHLVADVRYAVRTLAAKPSYTIAVVLTLTLGIGANSAMFSLVNAVVLRPLPYPDADRIVSLSLRNRGDDLGVVDDRDYFAWLDGARTVTIASYDAMEEVLVTQAGPQRLRGIGITANYFSIFGVRPLLGRAFVDDDYQAGGPPVVMLGEDVWRRDFAADPAVVGRSITLDGRPASVVGIVPATFATSRPVGFWRPSRLERPTNPDRSNYYFVVGRLRDGASIDAASADLTALSARLHASGTEAERTTVPIVMTLHERRYGDQRKPLLVLFASVGVLLLIACANLVNLALARAAERQREIAVRLALGASRWRVVQGLLCETIVLSLAGATLGLGVAVASLRYIVHLSPASVGNIDRVPLDAAVLAFTLAIAVLTGVMVGIVPAIAAVRGDIQLVLSSGGPRSTGSRTQRAVRRVLVVAQLATALVMLTAAGLTARTFWNVVSIDLAFEPDHLLDVTLRLPQPRFTDRTAEAFFSELLARVRALPAVKSAALTNTPPLLGGMTFASIDSTGRRTPQTTVIAVGPEYFRTIGATVRAGRAIDSTDRPGSPRAVVVNTALAKRLFGGDALGHTVAFGRDSGRVVGVIADLPQREFEGTFSGAAYVAHAQQEPDTYIHLVARYTGAVGPVQTAITRATQAMDGTLAPPPYRQMSDVLAERIAPRKFTFVLLGMFAALAASLAVIGLYGVLAHLVATRTREIGIRIALGADPRAVTRLVLAQGIAFAAVGVSIGVVASLFAVRMVQSLVYNVAVHDPRTFVASTALLLIVSVLASYIPALRASRVDPVIALQAN